MNLASYIVLAVVVLAASVALVYTKKHPSKCTSPCSSCSKKGSCSLYRKSDSQYRDNALQTADDCPQYQDPNK